MYRVPKGWVEQFRVDHGERLRTVFHAVRECPKVRAADTMRRVERPGSAARCRRCSPAS